jgi:hypothetical protein
MSTAAGGDAGSVVDPARVSSAATTERVILPTDTKLIIRFIA